MREADEINDEDLEAAAEFYDRLMRNCAMKKRKRIWTREAVRVMYRDCIQDLGLHPAQAVGEEPVFDAKIALSDNASLQALVNFALRITPVAVAAIQELKRRRAASEYAHRRLMFKMRAAFDPNAIKLHNARTKARLLKERAERKEVNRGTCPQI